MIAKTFLIICALITALQGGGRYDFSLATANGSSHSFGTWDSREVGMIGNAKQDRLIFKKDKKLYVITDKAVIASAKKALEPVNALGKQQGELGRQQGVLGRKQGEIGRQQGEIGRQQGLVAANWVKVRSSPEANKGAAAQFQKQRDLGKKQQALGAKQHELGNQQRILGQKQRDLGVRQKAASEKAGAEITKLIDGAIAKGLAKPVS